jgi:hypothetical protein
MHKPRSGSNGLNGHLSPRRGVVVALPLPVLFLCDRRRRFTTVFQRNKGLFSRTNVLNIPPFLGPLSQLKPGARNFERVFVDCFV